MKVNLYGIFKVQNGGSPKVGGPVWLNTSNMHKDGPAHYAVIVAVFDSVCSNW